MNLVDFKDKLSTNGLARNNTWELIITPPSGVSKIAESLFATSSSNNLQFTSTPGDLVTERSRFTTDDGIDRRNQTNRNLNYPNIQNTLSNINPLVRDLTLYANACSIPARDLKNTEFREYGEKRQAAFNHEHKDLITTFYCSEDLRERSFFELWQDLIFNPRNKQISYYKDYISTMLIRKYSTGWKDVMATYQFYELYPTNVGGMPLNFEGNQVLRLDVTFKYRNYTRIN